MEAKRYFELNCWDLAIKAAKEIKAFKKLAQKHEI